MKKKEFTLPEGITLTEQEQAIVDALISEFNAINEKIDGMKPDDASAVEEEVAKEMAKSLKAIESKFADAKKFTELEIALKAQGLVIASLKERPSAPQERKTVGQQFKEFYLGNPDKFKSFTNGEVKELRLALKTAGTILTSTNITGTIPQAFREPGLNDVAVERNFIMDVIGTSPTSSPTIEYMEKLNQDGTVAFKLDTEAFVQIDFDMEVNSSTAKDTGAFITVHENMLADIDFMAAEIDKELMYMIRKNADAEILAGTGLTSHLKGITQYATAGFSLTNIHIATPTIWDAVSAAMNQVRQVGFDEPNMILMHPADYENALGSKDDQGRYVGHPSLSPDGTRFAGIPISTTTFITAGYLLVGNKAKSNIKILQDVTLAIGYNLTGEFTKRHITVRGAMRLHHYIKDNDVYSFVYDAIQDIKDAITAV